MVRPQRRQVTRQQVVGSQQQVIYPQSHLVRGMPRHMNDFPMVINAV